MPRGARVKEPILNVMHQNAGMHMIISEVETAINDGRPEESRFDRKQVSNGLYNTAQAGLIRRVASGVYIYDAREPHMEKVTTDDHVYEIIGKLDDGSG